MIFINFIFSFIFVFYNLKHSYGEECTDSPLNCFLEQAEIVFPSPICEPTGGNEICIINMICSHFKLQGVPSSYLQPLTLEVEIQNFDAQCIGNYTYNGFPNMAGELDIKINNTDILVDLLIAKENDGILPISTTFDKCTTSMDIFINFIGQKGSNPVLNGFANVIENIVKNAVNTIVCVKGADFFAVNVTEVILTVLDPALEIIIESQPTIIPSIYNNNDDYINIADTIIGKIHNIFNIFQSTTIYDCIKDKYPDIIIIRPFINDVIDMVTNGTGIIYIDFSEKINSNNNLFESNLNFGMNNFTTVLLSLTITGLDSFTDIKFLEPSQSSNITLSTGFSLDYLNFTLQFMVNDELIEADIQIADIDIGFDIAIAIYKKLFDNLYIGQLFEEGCFASCVDFINISSIIVDLDLNKIELININSTSVTNKDIILLLHNAIQLITVGYEDMVDALIKGLAQGPMRQIINNGITNSISSKKDKCLKYTSNDELDLIVWSNSTIIHIVDKIINDLIGFNGINNILTCITNDTGSIDKPLRFNNWDIEISGLNTFYDFSILNPLYNGFDASLLYDLGNTIGIGRCNEDDCNPLSLAFTKISDDNNIYQDIILSTPSFPPETPITSISITLDNLHLYLDLLFELNLNAMKNLHISDLSVTGCISSTFPEIIIKELLINITNAYININNGMIVLNSTDAIEFILGIFSNPNFLREINDVIASDLSDDELKCQNGGVIPTDNDDLSEDNSTPDWEWQIVLFIFACVACLLVFVFFFNKYGKSSNISCLNRQNNLEKSEHQVISNPTYLQSLYVKYEFKNALIFQKKIPLLIRVGLPLAILVNIGMFIDANIILNAVSVDMTLYIGDKVITPPPIFEFGLKNTIDDMWDAKVYPLAILIAFFSCAWPYLKLIFMFVSLMLPPKLLNVATRERLLIFLDTYGKWSLVDTFVMVMFMCAFYMQLQLKDILVSLNVIPHWGFYLFLLSTMMSLGVGHICVGCHRLIVSPKINPTEDATMDIKSSLLNYKFEINSDWFFGLNDEEINLNEKVKVTITTKGRVFIIFTIFFTIFFLFFGCLKYTFAFEFQGLVGYLLKSNYRTDYSFYSVGKFIPTSSGTPDDFGIRWIETAYFAFGIGMPTAFLIASLILWLVPLNLSKQRSLFVVSEILNSWSSLDVFCVSIVAAMLQIQQFAAFIVGDSCDGINKILQKYFPDGDDICFDVVATIDPSAWTLFLPAILLLVVSIPTLQISTFLIKDRMKLAMKIQKNELSTKLNYFEADRENNSVEIFSYKSNEDNEKGKNIFEKLIIPDDVDEDDEVIALDIEEKKKSLVLKKNLYERFCVIILRLFLRIGFIDVKYNNDVISSEKDKDKSLIYSPFTDIMSAQNKI